MNPIPLLNNLGQWLVTNLGPLSLELALWTAVILLILTVLRVHSPSLRHLAWVLVLFKPLTTFLFQSPLAFQSLAPALPEEPWQTQVVQSFDDREVAVAVSPPEVTPPAEEPFSGYGVLACLWLAVAGVLLLRLLAGHIFLVFLRYRTTLVTAGPLYQVFQEAAAGLGIHRPVQLALVDRGGPLVAGIFHPLVILPHHLADTLSPDQLRLIFAHELAHVRRFDNLALLGQQLVGALLFFHPSAWLCRRGLRLEAEKACDDAVLHRFPDPILYADSLARVAELCSSQKPNLLINTFAAAESHLSWRITRILEARVMSRSRGLTSATALILVLACYMGLPGFLHKPAAAQTDSLSTSQEEQTAKEKLGKSPKWLPYYFSPKELQKIVINPAGGEPVHVVLLSVTLGLEDNGGEQATAALAKDRSLSEKLDPYMRKSQAIVIDILRSKTLVQFHDRKYTPEIATEIKDRLNEEVFAKAFKEKDSGKETGLIRVAEVVFNELSIQ